MIRRFEKDTAAGGSRHFPHGRDGAKIAKRRGFTLLELVVVVAVMAIILMMGIPAIRSATHRDPMSQGVVDFLDACQGRLDRPGARSLAILHGRPMELRIYPHEKRIEVGEANIGTSSGSGSTDNPGASDDAKPKPPPAMGFSAQLSDRLYFKVLDVNFLDCQDADVAKVRFYPDGTSDEFTVVLVSDTGEAKRITLDIVTGLPEVSNFP